MTANGLATPTVLVVDDSEAVRLKLRGLLHHEDGLELVGEAADGQTGLTLAAALQPDVVVMDLRMPGMSGIEATWKLATEAPGSRVLVLSVSSEQDDVADAIMAGALGYVVKDSGDDQIVAAIKRVAAGKRAISVGVAGDVVGRARGEAPSQHLQGRVAAQSPAAPGPQSPPAPPPEPEERPAPPPEPEAPAETETQAAPEPRAEPTARPLAVGWAVGAGLCGGFLVSAIDQGEAILNGAGGEVWIRVALNFAVTLAIAGITLLATTLED